MGARILTNLNSWTFRHFFCSVLCISFELFIIYKRHSADMSKHLELLGVTYPNKRYCVAWNDNKSICYHGDITYSTFIMICPIFSSSSYFYIVQHGSHRCHSLFLPHQAVPCSCWYQLDLIQLAVPQTRSTSLKEYSSSSTLLTFSWKKSNINIPFWKIFG